MDEPKHLTGAALDDAIAATPAAKVTKEQMLNRIKDVAYIRVGATVTICTIELDNGYSVRGESACVSPENYNRAIGESIAYSSAFEKLWALFGFLLAEDKFRGSGRHLGYCAIDDNEAWRTSEGRQRALEMALKARSLTEESTDAETLLLDAGKFASFILGEPQVTPPPRSNGAAEFLGKPGAHFFGEALISLREGLCVARKGWNGKGMWLYYIPANRYPAQTEAAKAAFGKTAPYRAYIAMVTVDRDVVPWVASQSDLLATDWVVVEPKAA